MKKIAVLFLCMTLLLSGCAVSSIAPGQAGVRYGLGGLMAALDGETALDLAGLNAVVEVAENDTTTGMRLYLENEGQVYAEFIVTVDAERVAIVANGQSSGSKVYTITDPGTVKVVAETIDGLTGEPLPDFENMTDEEWEAYMAQIEEQMGGELSGQFEMSEEEMQAAMEQAEQMSALMEKCLTEAEPREINGETYEGMDLRFTEEDVAELLRIRDLEGAAQSLEEGGLDINVIGGLYSGPTGGTYVELTMGLDIPGTGLVGVHLTSDGTVDGVSTIDVDVSGNGEELASVSLDLLNGGVDEAPWLDVDTSEAVDLTGMTDEEQENELMMVLGSLFGQALAGFAIAAANG